MNMESTPTENGCRAMRYVLLIDEAHVIFKEKKYQDILEKILREIRSKGVSVVLLSQGIEEFVMPVQSGGYPYTQEQYQNRLASSKFGLLLPGYGPKCNRDIECMAHGTVPIVVDGCDVNNYHEPWIEGIHYIGVKTPEEVTEKLSNISKNEWEYMHNACRSWYERNASPMGSFKLTEMLIEKYS